MSNAITARLGLDSSPFRKGLGDATKELSAASQRMAQSHKARGDAAEGVWEREKKIERQTEALAARLLNATSASDALGASLGTLAESLNLGIVSGAVAALGVRLIAKIEAATEAAKQFNETIAGATSDTSSMGSRGLAAYERQIENIQAQMAKLSEKKGWWASFWELVGEQGITNVGPSSAEEFAAKRDQQMTDLINALERARTNIAAIEAKKRADEEKKLQDEAQKKELEDLRECAEFEQKTDIERKQAEDKARAEKLAEQKKAIGDAAKEEMEQAKACAEYEKELKDNEREKQNQLNEEAVKRRVEKESKTRKEHDARVAANLARLAQTPDERRASRRSQLAQDRLANRAAREAGLAERAGHSQADVDAANAAPLAERVKPKSQIGPQEPLLEREARLRRQRAEEARRGLAKGRKEDDNTQLTEAMDASKMSQSIQNIEKNLKVNTK